MVRQSRVAQGKATNGSGCDRECPAETGKCPRTVVRLSLAPMSGR